MKRPLAFTLALLMIIRIVVWSAGDEDSSPLIYTEQRLYEHIGEGQQVIVSGRVKQCSLISSGVRLFIDQISVLSEDGSEINSEISFLPEQQLTGTIEEREIMPGDQVVLRGTFAPFLPATNPGQFDLREWYFAREVVCSLKKVEVLQAKKGDVVLDGLLYGIRRAVWDSYERILQEKAAGTMAAISLGEKGLMEQEWKTMYQEGGIAHIIAVSGLHIMLIGMSLYHFLRRIYVPIPVSAVLSGGVTFLYALMTGSGISAVRAVVMFLILLGAQVCGRKYDQITAVAVAAAVLVLPEPQVIRESSFWLSFSAILTLALLVPCMQKSCQIQSNLGKSLCSSVGVWMGMLPVTLFFFYQAAPWSILVNLLVIPLMSTVMGMGLLAAVAGFVSQTAGTFLGAPVEYLLQFFDFLCMIQQKLPETVWVAGKPQWWQIAVYYGVLVLVVCVTGRISGEGWVFRVNCSKTEKHSEHGFGWLPDKAGKKRICGFLWIVFLIAGFRLMPTRPSGNLQITCMDVGQGDGALIQLPDGVNCLIDCGSSSESSLWKYRAGQAVKYYGIRTIDYAFLSHADQDHVSGILEFLQNYECGWDGRNVHGITLETLVLPPTAEESDFEEIHNLCRVNGIQVVRMEAGDDIMADTWSIACLAPSEESLLGDSNQDSMVLMLEYGSFRMLFTGDLEGEAERNLAKQAAFSTDADILKAGHHGSKNASSEAFLSMVSPEAAIVSCGRNNSYGHPAQETLERLEECGAKIFSTAEQGAVRIASDGEKFQIYTY